MTSVYARRPSQLELGGTSQARPALTVRNKRDLMLRATGRNDLIGGELGFSFDVSSNTRALQPP